MPELPEVEYNRQIIHRNCLGLLISKVKCVDDNKVFDLPPQAIESKLLGQQIIGTGRHGKHFWCTLKDGSQLLLHLGMTGFVQIRGQNRSLYRAAPEKDQSEEWPPRFTKLTITFEGSVEMVYGDSRRFGRIKLFSELKQMKNTLKDLGFDPILSPISSVDEFVDIERRRVPVKSLLLEQSFCAGIGNWMADDILHHSGIHPEKPACELSRKDLERLLDSIYYISSTACRLRLQDIEYPSEWLFHCRWEAAKKKSFMHCGEKINVIRIGGRTTLYSPSKQKK